LFCSVYPKILWEEVQPAGQEWQPCALLSLLASIFLFYQVEGIHYAKLSKLYLIEKASLSGGVGEKGT